MDNVTNISTAKTRIEWLDGIKGISCLVLFILHFLMAFYPAHHFGASQPSHLDGFELWLLNSPFDIFLEGNVLVALFCMISGLVLTLQVMGMKNPLEKMPGVVINRYLRLVLPVIPIGFCVWLLLKLGLFFNIEAVQYTLSGWLTQFYTEEMSLTSMLSAVFIKIWFYGDDSISTAFWMLSQMFYGSFLAIILGMIYWKVKKYAGLLYLAVFVVFLPRHDFLAAFAVGAILAWMFKEGHMDIIKKFDIKAGRANSHLYSKIAGWLCIALGLFLGGYPSATEPTNYYRYMNIHFNEVWYFIGAFLIIFGVYQVEAVQSFLKTKPLKFLSRVCYDIYLLHIPIFFSVGMGLFVVMMRNGMNYNLAVIITGVITVSLVLVVSSIYNKYIGKACSVVSKKIMNFIQQEK